MRATMLFDLAKRSCYNIVGGMARGNKVSRVDFYVISLNCNSFVGKVTFIEVRLVTVNRVSSLAEAELINMCVTLWRDNSQSPQSHA